MPHKTWEDERREAKKKATRPDWPLYVAIAITLIALFFLVDFDRALDARPPPELPKFEQWKHKKTGAHSAPAFFFL